MKKIIAFTSLAIAGALVYFGIKAETEAKAVQNWQLGFEGAKYKGFDFLKNILKINLKYRIINRASVPLNIEKMRIEVYNKAIFIGLVETPAFSVRANGSDVVEIPLALENSPVIKAVTALLQNYFEANKKFGKDDFAIELIGFADYKTNTFGNVVRYPFTFKFDLKQYLPLPA